jgi:hypothetical protein
MFLRGVPAPVFLTGLRMMEQACQEVAKEEGVALGAVTQSSPAVGAAAITTFSCPVLIGCTVIENVHF